MPGHASQPQRPKRNVKGMKSLQFTAHIAQDGLLYIPLPECADQDIDVVILYAQPKPEPTDALIGEEALKLAQPIGFIGCRGAEKHF